MILTNVSILPLHVSNLTKLTIQGTAGQPILNIASSTGASLLYLDGNDNLTIYSTTTMGAVTYPNYDGVAWQVLYTDGAGNLLWTATSS